MAAVVGCSVCVIIIIIMFGQNGLEAILLIITVGLVGRQVPEFASN